MTRIIIHQYFIKEFFYVEHEHYSLKRLYAHQSYQTFLMDRNWDAMLRTTTSSVCVYMRERGEAEQWSSVYSQAASGGGGWANSSCRLQSTTLTHSLPHTYTHIHVYTHTHTYTHRPP